MASFKAIRRSVQYTLAYWGVRFLIAISTSISRKLWLSICGALGSFAYHLAGETRELTLRHLKMAFPDKPAREVRRLAKANFKMLGKNAGDILRSSRKVKELRDLENILRTY